MEGRQERGVSPEEGAKEEAAAAAAPEAGPDLSDFADDLAEAEFYCKQGFFNEAVDIYQRLIDKFPGNEDLITKLNNAQQELEGPAPAAKEPAPAAASEPAAAEDEFEGMETLSFDELSGVEPEPGVGTDVMEIFQEFKIGRAHV